MVRPVDDKAPVVEPTTSDNVVVSTNRVAVSGECDGDLDGDQARIYSFSTITSL